MKVWEMLQTFFEDCFLVLKEYPILGALIEILTLAVACLTIYFIYKFIVSFGSSEKKE